MKNKIFSNWGLKLLSLVLGFIVWLTVLNIDDYSTTRQINDIPVTLINTEAITDKNQLFNITSGETVDIIVKGRRSVVNALGASDFTAVADMSKLSITNAVNITVSANSPSVENAVSITIVDNVLQVELEEEQTVSLPVTVATKGETAEGYTTGTPSTTPNLITVTGAASLIERIDKVEVQVDVSNRTSDVTTTCTPVFYDAKGDEISSKNLESKVNSISVTVPVYRTKKVAVKLDTKGTPAENYKVVSVEYGPTEITIGGPTETIQNLNTITIDDIDISGCSEDVESTLDITKYLPEGVVIADENTSISVHVAIERNISRTLSLSDTDITIENKQADHTYTIQFPEGNTIVITGLSNDISKLTASDLNITIDADNLTLGENTVELSIPDSDTYSVDGTCIVTVEVTAMP